MHRKRVREPFHFYDIFMLHRNKKKKNYPFNQLDVQNLDKEFIQREIEF